MAKSKIDIEYVANLARINLSSAEISNFKKQFADILAYVEKLDSVDTKNVPPTSHILPVKNVFRDDRIEQSLTAEEALSNAPARKGDLFKVPKIIEEA